MKKVWISLFAVSIIIAGCSKDVAQQEEEPVHEDIEQVENEQEQQEEEPVENEEVVEKIKDDVASGESEQEKETSNKETNKSDEQKQPLTEDGAVQLLKEHLRVEYDETIHVLVDREEDGKYVLQVFEVIDDGQNSHTATLGWYTVDKNTGEIRSIM
ncbi:hypothetical protein [Alkalihalobacillus sp. LMS39]|uniref:hypothetical protein n=1 Tax=Alkalihalobacillus sp. LMS39 TaxID=2924032 RepID=UPI001FB4EF92|nr:hypothetical protein [Alkalihalobacillus sp. LMS39]UOE93897.1 hypothetical protein MM271_22435 [Alkalihalobacillus sp. LMS39]